MLAYGVAEFGCVSGWGEAGPAHASWVAWLEMALTLVTAATAATATAVAYRSYRCLREPGTGEQGATDRTARSAAWAGTVTSGLFTFIILFESIPILFYLRSCSM
jgi:hypothetical protein